MTTEESLEAIRDGYLAALVADAANPRPSYELNGKRVSWTEWRQALLQQMAAEMALIASAAPYVITTVARL